MISLTYRRLLVTGFFLLAGLVSCGGSDATGPGSGGSGSSGGWIVFAWDSAGTHGLAAIRPDGSGFRFLAPPIAGREIDRVVVSDNGKWVAAVGDGRVITVNTNGSGLVQYEQLAGVLFEDLSPDGKRLLWFRGSTPTETINDVFSTATDGSDLVPAPSSIDFQRVLRARYQRVGLKTRIVFWGLAAGVGSEIYSMKPDGGDLRQITDTEFQKTDPYPSPSPASPRIAYLSTTGSPTSKLSLRVVDSNGNNDVVLIPLSELGDRGQVQEIAWASNASRIAATVEGSNDPGIWTVNSSGGEFKRLFPADALDIRGFGWSPDAKRLVLSAKFPQSDLIIIDSETLVETKLTDTPLITERHPVWVP